MFENSKYGYQTKGKISLSYTIFKNYYYLALSRFERQLTPPPQTTDSTSWGFMLWKTLRNNTY